MPLTVKGARMPKSGDTQRNSKPLAPHPQEQQGPRAYAATKDIVSSAKQPEKGTLVSRAPMSKNPMGDPSVGTARFRAQALERSGAQFRVTPNVFPPVMPEAAATQANGRIITSRPAVMRDKRYSPAVNENFQDAAVVAGRDMPHWPETRRAR